MRNVFADTLAEAAAKDQRLVLLSGDMGNRLFDSFKQKFPNRFYNCGVAEANMMSMAAGMSMCGLKPFVYTIASFVTLRCFEQICLDVCYNNASVVIVGVGAGMSYASLGPTHHSCGDIALMRSLPHMTIICPGDLAEVRESVRLAVDCAGPVYIRLGKKEEFLAHQNRPDFSIGKSIVVREGKDVCLLSTGNMLSAAVQAAEELGKKGISAQAASFHTVKPMDEDMLFKVFLRFPLVVTIEEHSLIGGFGSGIAEWLADHPQEKGRLLRIGINDEFFCEAGDPEYVRSKLGLSPEAIAKKVICCYEDCGDNRR